MARATYTDAQKQEALDLYREHGPAEAARLTGIPKTTISSWAQRNGVRTDAPQNAHEATEARTREWTLRRLAEANAAGEAASRAREAILQALQDGAIKGRDLAVVYGVLIDKAQLLSGEATSRSEIHGRSDLDRDIASLLDEFHRPESAPSSNGPGSNGKARL